MFPKFSSGTLFCGTFIWTNRFWNGISNKKTYSCNNMIPYYVLVVYYLHCNMEYWQFVCLWESCQRHLFLLEIVLNGFVIETLHPVCEFLKERRNIERGEFFILFLFFFHFLLKNWEENSLAKIALASSVFLFFPN